MDRLETFRASYARVIAAIAGVPADGSRIVEAFASVPRERFLRPGPWRIVTQGGYVSVPTDDPAFLYQDFAVGLKPEQQINNGQPSLHARCFAALQIKEGEKIIHVGAGAGYYSALLAVLTGPAGVVEAYELDTDLADKATANRSGFPNLTVQNRSGVEGPLPTCDVIYVSAGATAPLDVWLDALRPGGRLLFPLTADQGFGGMLLVTKTATGNLAARFLIPVSFIHCLGAREAGMAMNLAEAYKNGGLTNVLRTGGLWNVQSLHRNSQPDDTCWFAGGGWWLSTRAVSNG